MSSESGQANSLPPWLQAAEKESPIQPHEQGAGWAQTGAPHSEAQPKSAPKRLDETEQSPEAAQQPTQPRSASIEENLPQQQSAREEIANSTEQLPPTSAPTNGGGVPPWAANGAENSTSALPPMVAHPFGPQHSENPAPKDFFTQEKTKRHFGVPGQSVTQAAILKPQENQEQPVSDLASPPEDLPDRSPKLTADAPAPTDSTPQVAEVAPPAMPSLAQPPTQVVPQQNPEIQPEPSLRPPMENQVAAAAPPPAIPPTSGMMPPANQIAPNPIQATPPPAAPPMPTVSSAEPPLAQAAPRPEPTPEAIENSDFDQPEFVAANPPLVPQDLMQAAPVITPFDPVDDPNQYLAPPAGLDQNILVDPVKRAPKSGWRKFVHSITAGHVNLGDSEKVDRHQRLIEQVKAPLRGDYRVAILSLKGGVGKTTTSVMLGGMFASLRGDRVIAIDANPDFGNLAQRAAVPRSPTIRDLLNATDIKKYSDARKYTTQAESSLEVIGSDRDPEIAEAFSEADYRQAIDILQHYYNIILTDCGTGLMHSAMRGVLDLANTLILVTSPALDGAQSASATLDWLSHQGYGKFVSNAIVVVSALPTGTPSVDVDQLVEHFKSRTRAVQIIPYDRHLSEGAIIDLERLDRKTYLAYLELAAVVAQDFSSWHRHARES